MNPTETPRPSSGAIAAGRVAIVAMLAAASLVVAWSVWPPRVVGSFSDSIDYLTIADYIAHAGWGRPLPDAAGAAAYFRETRFPPGYPAVLALAGGGLLAPQSALLVTGLTLVLALATVSWWLVRERGPRDAALLLAALLASIGIVMLAVEPMSEPLFILLLFGGLALLARRVPSSGLVLLAAVVFGLLPLVRTIGVACVAGFVVYVLRRRDLVPVVRSVAAALSLLPVIAWAIVRSGHSGQSYLAQLDPERMEQVFGGWQGWLLDQPIRFIEGFAQAYQRPEPGVAAISVVVFVAVMALHGWFARLRAGHLDAHIAWAYLGLVFVWPFPHEIPRLLLPIVPLAFVAAVDGAARMAPRAAEVASPALALAFVALASGSIRTAVTRALDAGVAPEAVPFTRSMSYLVTTDAEAARASIAGQAATFALHRRLQSTLPPGACVYSMNALQTWYHSRVRAETLPLDIDLTPGLGARLTTCDYVLLVAGRVSPYPWDGEALYSALEPEARLVDAAYVDRPGAAERAVGAVLLAFDRPAATRARRPADE